MEAQTFRSPLRSIKLVIRNQATMRQFFDVKVMESNLINGKIEARVADKIETNSVSELGLFMGKYGVGQDQLHVAGQVMAQMDHNGADFGWFGGFVHSFIDAVMQ